MARPHSGTAGYCLYCSEFYGRLLGPVESCRFESSQNERQFQLEFYEIFDSPPTVCQTLFGKGCKKESESRVNIWMGCKNLHVMLKVKNIYMDVWNVAQQSLEICFTVLGWLSCSELYLNVEIFLSDSQL